MRFLFVLMFLSISFLGKAQCSYVSGILVNACGGSAEGINEMVTIEVGSDTISWDDISITFPNGGEYCNSCTKTWTTNSSYVSTFLESDCPLEDLIIEVGVDTDSIPPNARLIIFTGSTPTFDFDFSNLCGTGPYYVMFADNTSTSGRFANSASADRTLSYDIDGCTGDATYYSSSSNTGTDGDGVTFDEFGNPTYVNSCDAIPLIGPPIIMELDTTQVVFNQLTKEVVTKEILHIFTIDGREVLDFYRSGVYIVVYDDFSRERVGIIK